TIHNETRAFEHHYGRKPTGNDPVFFNPYVSGVQPLAGECLNLYLDELARRTGLTPARIYAHHKLYRQIRNHYDPRLWSEALSEYESLSRTYKKM
ncbi:MAG: hypothetical protein JOZ10_12145, partial [Acidobacteria bacterium]|nr:hypothetical protein [Acidobacteriota bacterium]